MSGAALLEDLLAAIMHVVIPTGGTPPSLSCVEVQWNDQVTGLQTMQNIHNKGVSRKIFITNELAGASCQRTTCRAPKGCARKFLTPFYRIRPSFYAKLTD